MKDRVTNPLACKAAGIRNVTGVPLRLCHDFVVKESNLVAFWQIGKRLNRNAT